MNIVGELINTSRQKVKEAVISKDEKYIIELAKKQQQAGATYLDINCGTMMDKEKDCMEWLVRTIRPNIDLPLCIDSPDPKVIRIGLNLCGENPMINSTTFETGRFNSITPLAVEYNAKLISLCIDDNGMPNSADERVDIAKRMIDKLVALGISIDNIYIDPLVKPISAGQEHGTDVLNAIYRIVRENKGVHMICGLTNISYSLPARKHINKTFMIQTMAMGMDSYIIDITDNDIAGAFYASHLLLGHDKFCRNYLKAYRNGIYGEIKK